MFRNEVYKQRAHNEFQPEIDQFWKCDVKASLNHA